MSWGTAGTPRRPIQPSHSINHHLEKELNIDSNFCLARGNRGCYPPIMCKTMWRRIYLLDVCIYIQKTHSLTELVSQLASGQAHEYNPLCAHKSKQLHLEMERSLRGTDKKHDRDVKETILYGHQPVRYQDVLLLRIVYNLWIIHGTNISYLWHVWLDLFMTCTVCLNNEFIIYWRQISGEVTSHYYMLDLQ